MKLRPLGQIMHDMEDVILALSFDENYSWSKIISLTKVFLKQYCTQGQEEYVEGGSPNFVILPLFSFKLKKHSKNSKKLLSLLKEMSTTHDMQWYEIVYLIYGYLQVHCPDNKDKNFKFYYGA